MYCNQCMHQLIFVILISIIVIGYIAGQWLSWLNIRHSRNPVPSILQGIYDNDKYARQQDYMKSNFRFDSIQTAFSTVGILVLLFTGAFVWLDDILRGYFINEIWLCAAFFAVLAFAADIASIPFDAYDTFVIEKKYGFNKTSSKTFIFDRLKSWFLMAAMGGGLLLIITSVYMLAGEWFWLIAWAVFFVVSLLMNVFYSDLIVPLFNKQKPLDEGPLREAISSFAASTGFSLKKIMVIDGSKRSTKANAYFAGFGSRKRVVLYDTLIEEMSTEEIVAVLAHEIGHYKKKHIITMLFISTFVTGLTLFLMSLLLKYPVFTQALGFENHSFHSGILIFGILFAPVSAVLGIIANIISRRNEYEADAFAASHSCGEALISALKKLSSRNLSNLTPHPWYVFINYSHPTLYQRIEKLNHINSENITI